MLIVLCLSMYAASGFGNTLNKELNKIKTPAGLITAANGEVKVAGKVVYEDGSVQLHDFGEAGILIEGHHGGRHCPNTYHIIDRDTGKLRVLDADADRSTLFAECLRLSSVIADLGLVVMQPAAATEQARIFAFNGKTMVETVIKRANQQAKLPGGGDEVHRWSGKYLFEYLENLDERKRLLTVLSEEELKFFSFYVLRGAPMYEKDGFIVGQGCDPDMCNANWAVLGLRIADGAPFVLMPDDIKRMPAGEKMPKVVLAEAQSMN